MTKNLTAYYTNLENRVKTVETIVSTFDSKLAEMDAKLDSIVSYISAIESELSNNQNNTEEAGAGTGEVSGDGASLDEESDFDF